MRHLFREAPELVPALFRGVLQGIRMLHSRRLAHGDLKPENIGFSKEGAAAFSNSANVKLMDMGSCTPQSAPPPEINSVPLPAVDEARQGIRVPDCSARLKWVFGVPVRNLGTLRMSTLRE